MASTYLIVIDRTGRALLLRKKVYGRFFARKPIDGPTPPFQVLNAAGQYACSGGKLESREKPSAGAMREFLEETGIHVDQFSKVIAEEKFKGYFLTVCAVAGPEDLDQLERAIAANLKLGREAVADDEIAQVSLVRIADLPTYLGVRQALTKEEQADVEYYVSGTGPYRGKDPKPHSQAIDWYAEIAVYLQTFA